MEANKPSILVVEDEEAIRTGLVDVLVYHGFKVDFADDGARGLALCLSGRYDLVLLDVMLPGMDGFSICNRVREEDRDLPIIMLTAKSSDEDIIQGLRLGADDYITKPFSVAQLVLRVQAVLRRTAVGKQLQREIKLVNGATIDTQNLSGTLADDKLVFTRKELDVLLYLYSNAERPVSREELLNKVWGYNKGLELETRTVDIHIAKLRRKLEHDAKNPEALITVRGAGYRLLSETGNA